MNYREKMRKAIECPQFGNINYGEWGALRLDQRKNIKRLLDEMDRADAVIKHQFFEIERLNNIINRTTKYVQGLSSKGRGCDIYEDIKQEILKELKGSNEPSFEEMVGFVENVYKDIKSQSTLHEELEEERKTIAKIVGDFKEINK